MLPEGQIPTVLRLHNVSGRNLKKIETDFLIIYLICEILHLNKNKN